MDVRFRLFHHREIAYKIGVATVHTNPHQERYKPDWYRWPGSDEKIHWPKTEESMFLTIDECREWIRRTLDTIIAENRLSR